MTVAVVLIQLAASATIAKQMAACTAYVVDRRYQVAGYIRAGGASADAVRMISAGEASVVVVAFGGRDIAAAVIAAGGRVEAVHPVPHVVEPPVPPPPPPPPRSFPRSARDMIARMVRRGRTAKEIADLIGENTEDIRRMMDPPQN